MLRFFDIIFTFLRIKCIILPNATNAVLVANLEGKNMEKNKHDLLFASGILLLVGYFVWHFADYLYYPKFFVMLLPKNLLNIINTIILIFMAVTLIIGKKSTLLGISLILKLCISVWILYNNRQSLSSFNIITDSIEIVFYLLVIISVFWPKNIIERKIKFLYIFLPACVYVISIIYSYIDNSIIDISPIFIFISPINYISLICMGAGISGISEKNSNQKWIGFTGFALFFFVECLIPIMSMIYLLKLRSLPVYDHSVTTGFDSILHVLIVLLGITFLMVPFAFFHNEEINNNTKFCPKDINNEDFSVLKYILLTIVTLGIWDIVFIYKTTKYFDEVIFDGKCGPVTEMLMCLFVPFYSVYWFYKYGKKIEIIASFKGYSCKELPASLMILRGFGWIFASIYLQSRLKEIVSAPDKSIVLSQE